MVLATITRVSRLLIQGLDGFAVEGEGLNGLTGQVDPELLGESIHSGIMRGAVLRDYYGAARKLPIHVRQVDKRRHSIYK